MSERICCSCGLPSKLRASSNFCVISCAGVSTVSPDTFPLKSFLTSFCCVHPAAHPEERYEIFGAGGGQKVAAQLGVPLLSQIPLVQGIREAGDAGQPAALGTGPDAAAFLALASSLASSLAHHQADNMMANNQ